MDRETLSVQIGSMIRKYRIEKELSQESLSMTAGLHPAYIGRLERGEKCPTIDTLYKISDALGISVCKLLDFESGNAVTEIVRDKISDSLERIPTEKHSRVIKIIDDIADLLEVE